MKTVYAVMRVCLNDIGFTDEASGKTVDVIGFLPVFKTKLEATKYIKDRKDDKASILLINMNQPKGEVDG